MMNASRLCAQSGSNPAPPQGTNPFELGLFALWRDGRKAVRRTAV